MVEILHIRDDEIWGLLSLITYYVLDNLQVYSLKEDNRKAKSTCDLNYGPYYFGLLVIVLMTNSI